MLSLPASATPTWLSSLWSLGYLEPMGLCLMAGEFAKLCFEPNLAGPMLLTPALCEISETR